MLRAWFVALSLLVSQAALSGAHDLPFQYDPDAPVPPLFPGTKNPMPRWEVEPIGEGLYGFRYTFYRTIFLVTDEGVIVADPLKAEAAEILRDEIAKLTDQPVRFVSYSHSHWDHASGAQVFVDGGAKVVAQEICAAQFAENPNPKVVPPDITYTDYYEIELGGRALEMHYFGPSHDSCMVVMVARPANQLFMVDLANPPDGWSMFYNPGVSEDRVWHMVPFFNQVQALVEERGIDTVIGAHMSFGRDPDTGKLGIIRGTQGPSTVIAERRDFWAALIEVVQAELARGTPPAEVPDRLVASGALADRISSYEPAKMQVLLQRITSYAITGE